MKTMRFNSLLQLGRGVHAVEQIPHLPLQLVEIVPVGVVGRHCDCEKLEIS